MARRSIFVAAAALAVALVPAAAQAATPGRTSALFASPVTFSWTPDPLVLTEQLLRAPGACPQAGLAPVGVPAPIGVPLSTASDTPGEGVFCYAVQNDPALNGSVGPGVTVTVDTANPTATIAVTPTGAPNFLRGTVNITSTSADTGSGVASSVLHEGGVIAEGSIDDVSANERVVEVYLGR